jgi:hypothetical protein
VNDDKIASALDENGITLRGMDLGASDALSSIISSGIVPFTFVPNARGLGRLRGWREEFVGRGRTELADNGSGGTLSVNIVPVEPIRRVHVPWWRRAIYHML